MLEKISEVPEEIAAAVTAARDAIDRRAALVRHAGKWKVALPGLRQAMADAARELDEVEVDLAVATDDDVNELTDRRARSIAAKAAAEDAVLQAERGERVALERATEVDGAIEAAHAELNAVLRPWSDAIVETFRADLLVASGEFIRTLRRGYAIATALSRSRLRDALNATTISDPTAQLGQALRLLDNGGRLRGDLASDGNFEDLSASFAVDPLAASLARLLAPIGVVERAAGEEWRRIVRERVSSEAQKPRTEPRRPRAPAADWPPPSWEEIRAERQRERERLIAEGKISPSTLRPHTYSSYRDSAVKPDTRSAGAVWRPADRG